MLYKQGKDVILRQCVSPSEVSIILKDFHNDVWGVFCRVSNCSKDLQFGDQCPTLFFAAARYAKRCDPC